MIGFAARAAGLAGVYLLVLTSLRPGDVAVGAVLGVAVAAGLRPRRPGPAGVARLTGRGVMAELWRTAVEVVRGTWRVARFCLGGRVAPGLVEIPRADRSRVEVALWGVLTGEAPDEYPVDVDDERNVLIVHVLDAGDPDGLRERHRTAHDRMCGRPEV